MKSFTKQIVPYQAPIEMGWNETSQELTLSDGEESVCFQKDHIRDLCRALMQLMDDLGA